MTTKDVSVPPAQSVEDLRTTTYSGRRFTRAQLGQVIEIVRDFPGLSRQELAETVCECLDWRNPRGRNKTGCALKLLETLEGHGLCSLPRKRETAAPASATVDFSLAEKEPKSNDATGASLSNLLPIKLVKVRSAEDHAAFIASIEVHHYLGDARPVGNYLEYFIVSQQTGQRLGCIREVERKLNSGNGQASHQPQQCLATPSQQVNFKNCVHIVGSHLEALLGDPASATEASELASSSIMRQRRTTRPGRHYERQSLRPRTKWSPNRKKRATTNDKAKSGTATMTICV